MIPKPSYSVAASNGLGFERPTQWGCGPAEEGTHEGMRRTYLESEHSLMEIPNSWAVLLTTRLLWSQMGTLVVRGLEILLLTCCLVRCPEQKSTSLWSNVKKCNRC